MLFLFLPHFKLYMIEVEAPEIFSGAYFLSERRSENVQQSKIHGARNRKRDFLMADEPDVAYGSDDGSREKRLPAGIQADKNADRQHIVHE